MKVNRLPCIRHKISESKLIKPKFLPEGFVHRFGQFKNSKYRDITIWAPSEPRYIFVSQDLTPTPLQIRVREFIPVKEDILHRFWLDKSGQKREVVLPCYATDSWTELKDAVTEYHTREGKNFLLTILDKADQFVFYAYDRALARSSVSPVSSNHTFQK